MRLPRITTRRMMVLVAAIAVMLGVIVGLQDRRQRLLTIANDHRSRMIAWEEVGITEASRKRFDLMGREVSLEEDRRHRRMAETYERAARRPWLPVAPEPTEPK